MLMMKIYTRKDYYTDLICLANKKITDLKTSVYYSLSPDLRSERTKLINKKLELIEWLTKRKLSTKN